MLGMDWLRQHRCRLGFGAGALFVGRHRINLVKGNGQSSCRRIQVAEEVTLAPRSQQDVLSKMVGVNPEQSASAWMTDSREIGPGCICCSGVLSRFSCTSVARMTFSDNMSEIPIQIINLNDRPVKLSEDQFLGNLHSVEVETVPTATENKRNTVAASLVEVLMREASELQQQDKDCLKQLLEEFSDVFSKGESDLGRTDVCKHRIDTGDSAPVRQPLRRQPHVYKAVIDEHLRQMLSDGIIEPATSEWVANVVLAKKKDGSVRFCIDYRQLKTITKKDSYPLPRVDDCLDALAGACWISTLDLRSGYHQVAMNQKMRIRRHSSQEEERFGGASCRSVYPTLLGLSRD